MRKTLTLSLERKKAAGFLLVGQVFFAEVGLEARFI